MSIELLCGVGGNHPTHDWNQYPLLTESRSVAAGDWEQEGEEIDWEDTRETF